MPGIKAMNIILPALLATAGAYAVPYQRRGMDQVISQCKHNFAYTFDDGPYKWNTDLVNTFNSVGAKTTFFVNGNNWGCIYSDENVKALRYAYEQGHEIASHTWSHPNITKLNFAQIDEEIARLDEAFVKILGVKPKIFRPPFGEINETSASYIQAKYGKTIVLWDLDSGDTWAGANEQGSVDFYNTLAAEGASSKHLPLSHEVWEYAVKAAEDHTVAALHKAGIKLLTVSDCLDTTPYEKVGEYGVRDASWTCDGPWKGASANTATTSSSSTTTTTTSTTPTTTPTPTPTTTPTTTPTPTPTTTPATTPTTTPPATTPAPACKETYKSAAGDDCTKIEAKYNLVPGTLKFANPFVTCNDIWTGTPLCIPNGPYSPTTTTPTTTTTPPSPSPSCKQTYSSAPGDTCSSIEAKFNLKDGTILPANKFLTCSNIWAYTPICVPDGPYKSTNSGSEPSCVTQGYKSVAGDTCSSIETAFALQAGAVAAANGWVNCADLWAGTGLALCVPALAPADAQACTKRAAAGAPTTCAAVGAANGVSAAWIKAWNPWVNCADIWQGTDLCVAH